VYTPLPVPSGKRGRERGGREGERGVEEREREGWKRGRERGRREGERGVEREKERERGRESVCVCVCVRERERERRIIYSSTQFMSLPLFSLLSLTNVPPLHKPITVF
jgi:hypothetical protein